MTNIIGIGSYAAGLSAYLATLAYHKKHQVKSKKVLSCEDARGRWATAGG